MQQPDYFELFSDRDNVFFVIFISNIMNGYVYCYINGDKRQTTFRDTKFIDLMQKVLPHQLLPVVKQCIMTTSYYIISFKDETIKRLSPSGINSLFTRSEVLHNMLADETTKSERQKRDLLNKVKSGYENLLNTSDVDNQMSSLAGLAGYNPIDNNKDVYKR